MMLQVWGAGKDGVWGQIRDTKPPNRLENRFQLRWLALGGPVPEKEIPPHQGRKWRADFAHLPSRTLIEIEGGIYVHGRYNLSHRLGRVRCWTFRARHVSD